MQVDNKTILISGLLVCAGISLIIKNHDVALAIVAGLVGYLSKDGMKQGTQYGEDKIGDVSTTSDMSEEGDISESETA